MEILIIRNQAHAWFKNLRYVIFGLSYDLGKLLSLTYAFSCSRLSFKSMRADSEKRFDIQKDGNRFKATCTYSTCYFDD